jgi:hypothetical protein
MAENKLEAVKLQNLTKSNKKGDGKVVAIIKFKKQVIVCIFLDFYVK